MPTSSSDILFIPTTAATDNQDVSNPSTTDPFWYTESVDLLQVNWDKSHPYQLQMVTYEGADSVGQPVYKEGPTFTLPLPPQSLAIQTPFAINMAVTMGGIIEEHNGTPIRNISLQGSTGHLPLRGQTPKAADLLNIPAILAGTSSAQKAISQAQNLIGSPRQQSHLLTNEELSGANNQILSGSGFSQFLRLKRFLETYAYRKKSGETRLRLVFSVWKEEEHYLVTPLSFDVVRSAASPMEYSYSLSMAAWKRIRLNYMAALTHNYTGRVGISGPRDWNWMVNKLSNLRGILQGAKSTLQGVRADVETVFFSPMRQVLLLGKDAAGVSVTLGDLPGSIVKDAASLLLENKAGIAAMSRAIESIGDMKDAQGNDIQTQWNTFLAEWNRLGAENQKKDTGAGEAPVRVGRPPPPRIPARYSASPVYKDFTKWLEQTWEYIKDQIPVSTLNARPPMAKQISDEIGRSRNLTNNDFTRFSNDSFRLLADFSDSVGAGAPTYTSIFGLPQRTSTRQPTESDWEVIHAISEVCQVYDALAVSYNIDPPSLSSMDYVAGLALQSGIAFKTSVSKYSVPFPYGYSLEQLSNQYLDTPDRWHEIAVLNGLQAPYVDETGFRLPILTNGIDRQVSVADASNLFVGQLVRLASDTVRPEERRIQALNQVAPSVWTVQLDGEADCDRFTTNGKAYLQAFLPNTVNSGQQIFIPSDTEPEADDYRTKDIPGVDYHDPYLRAGGIDLLLTTDGDLVITPDGGGRLAVGLTNLIQRTKLALSTPQGSLLHHPTYGIGLNPGISTADVSVSQVLQSIKTMFQDNSYVSVKSAAVAKSGNTMTIRASIGVSGGSQFIPIQVEVKP